jgi:serine/threonine-protein kinase RsbW
VTVRDRKETRVVVEHPQKVEVVSLKMPSRLELLGILDQIANSLSERLEFAAEQRSEISMSVIEAGTNAIQHGHKLDPQKEVDVRFEMHPDRLLVYVRDTGPGFVPPEGMIDITSPDHLLDERGRGIYIMRWCMDEVDFDFTSSGTTCVLTKIRKPHTNGSP